MVRQYVPADYTALGELYKTWGLPPPSRDFLPHIGYMVDGLACGFIYFTDSKVAIIDNFITNKQAEREVRDIALDKIIEALLGSAKTAGCKLVKCDSNLNAIKQRASNWGAVCLGDFTVYAKGI